eukprot:444190-Lingulodinium_polyedra.AAC.1
MTRSRVPAVESKGLGLFPNKKRRATSAQAHAHADSYSEAHAHTDALAQPFHARTHVSTDTRTHRRWPAPCGHEL